MTKEGMCSETILSKIPQHILMIQIIIFRITDAMGKRQNIPTTAGGQMHGNRSMGNTTTNTYDEKVLASIKTQGI